MKRKRTLDDARRAATKAGRLHAVKQGRPTIPWTKDDMQAANAMFHRYIRKHKINTGPMLP